VVFVTGSDSPANEDARRQAGAAETIIKPLDPAHLLARVEALLLASAQR
jgi:DNA-binding response OmpR family regulator